MLEKNTQKRQASVESALNGDYEFDLKAVFDEGWKLTQADKSSIVQGMLVVIVIAMSIMLMAAYVSEAKGISWEEPGFRFGLDIIMAVLIAPLTAALMMMGIKSSVGRKNYLADLFGFINRTLVITVTVVMTTAIVQIGLLFLVLPGLYLMIATGFAIPLVLEKNMLPAKAIFTSIKVVNHQWLNFVKLYAVFFALLLLVALTFGIAMIWVAPFYYNVKGILYRDIFGVQNAETISQSEGEVMTSADTQSSELKTPDQSGKDDHFNA
ncbi:hypothetical protein [Planctobacterium marinum]|uniref:Integral membrane protein n=1 Tax=Planctobacterium marinum TaxID=1631968 RepID=A0AA48HHJ4_9ALTE|nr:hypothetical protein MACH26_20520 [Planctobacterium marinum]